DGYVRNPELEADEGIMGLFGRDGWHRVVCIPDLDVNFGRGKERSESPRVQARLRRVSVPPPAGLELNHRRAAVRASHDTIDDAANELAGPIGRLEGKRHFVQTLPGGER